MKEGTLYRIIVMIAFVCMLAFVANTIANAQTPMDTVQLYEIEHCVVNTELSINETPDSLFHEVTGVLLWKNGNDITVSINNMKMEYHIPPYDELDTAVLIINKRTNEALTLMIMGNAYHKNKRAFVLVKKNGFKTIFLTKYVSAFLIPRKEDKRL